MTPRPIEEDTTEGPRAYPDADDPFQRGLQRRNGDGPPWWRTVLVIVVTVLVIALFVALHLTGAVGPGAH